MGEIILILGGERSGKSHYALDLLEKSPMPAGLLVTAKALDSDFSRQIMQHKQERGPHFPVREVGLDLAQALTLEAERYKTLLVEGLDYWLYACSQAGCTEQNSKDFFSVLCSLSATVIFVSCEVGLGPVAGCKQTRMFVRELGSLNRRLAKLASRTILVVAGHALPLGES